MATVVELPLGAARLEAMMLLPVMVLDLTKDAAAPAPQLAAPG